MDSRYNQPFRPVSHAYDFFFSDSQDTTIKVKVTPREDTRKEDIRKAVTRRVDHTYSGGGKFFT